MTEILLQFWVLLRSLVLEPLILLWPLKWVVVQPGSKAVRFTRGIPGCDLGLGWHFATSTQRLVHLHCRRRLYQTERLPVITKDGVSLRIDAVVAFEIMKLGMFLTATEGSEEYVGDMVEAEILRLVRGADYHALLRNLPKKESDLTEELTDDLLGGNDAVGVNVHRFRIQSVEHADPHVRTLLGLPAASRFLEKQGLLPDEAVARAAILSPSVQFVSVVGSSPEEETSTGPPEDAD